MKTDIQIARECKLAPIGDIAKKLAIPSEEIEYYGKNIAKVPESLIDEEKVAKSKLILVTAITPTKAGIGKTTVSIGLALGLNKIGKNAVVALREPSLGPCFGMKGGAAGGGYAQVLPMEKINLHFTGDFHAITSAHNMIAALLDNYIYQHRDEGFALKEVLWKRVLDINDRNLRFIVTGLGAKTDGVTMESGFDITPASEIMAILCLATSQDDLRRRIENILLGITIDGKPFRVKDMGVAGAITVLLMDALHPNLVQTTEQTPAFVHGGPFANIAHGCNSILATKLAMTYGDYVITEAGFGADLGAEKFYDIKCRKAGLQPKLTVIVATTQGLKLHGGVAVEHIKEPNEEGLLVGLQNLDRHIRNLQGYGQEVVVAFNRYATDTDEELELVRKHCEEQGVTKIEKVCKNIYGAATITFSKGAERKLAQYAEEKQTDEASKQLARDIASYPVCIAKTQYSFSADPALYGCPSDFNVHIRDIVFNCGAEMVVAIAGEILRMPGLPRSPQAERIDIVDGNIEGLS